MMQNQDAAAVLKAVKEMQAELTTLRDEHRQFLIGDPINDVAGYPERLRKVERDIGYIKAKRTNNWERWLTLATSIGSSLGVIYLGGKLF